MYKILKEKVEDISVKYADLIEKRISKALGNDIEECNAMSDIENGIKMLGYLIISIDRMGRSHSGNCENSQTKTTD